MLAGGNRLQHQRLGDAVAANQLHHHVDIGVGNHGAGIVHHLNLLAHNGAGALHVQIGHHGNFNAPPSAAGNLLLVALQNGKRATTDGANA